VNDPVTISVAPTFATNFRAKVISAVQPRRLMSFALAFVLIIYYAVRGPNEQYRHYCMAIAILLPLARLLVVVLSSIVSKANREFLSMTLRFADEAIEVTRWGIAKEDDWSFVRRAYRQQGTLALQLQNSYDWVLVDRARVSADDWNRLQTMLARHGKL
jgi:hypothetical protein